MFYSIFYVSDCFTVQGQDERLPQLPPALAGASQQLQGLAGPALVADMLAGVARLRQHRTPGVPHIRGGYHSLY